MNEADSRRDGKWVSREDELPDSYERVLIYSPCYYRMNRRHEMAFRIISGEFFRIATDATHWMRLSPPMECKRGEE